MLNAMLLYYLTDHFTVSCLVAWHLNESEAGGSLFFLKKPPCFSYVNDAVLMVISKNLYTVTKAVRFLPKQGHLQPPFHSKARQLSLQL